MNPGTGQRVAILGVRNPRKRSLTTPRKSPLLTGVMCLALLYTLLPIVWLLISATKTQQALSTSPGLWFSGPFSLWQNISATFTYGNGEFWHWALNTILYVVAGGGGATVLATLGGYGLAHFDMPGKRPVLAVVIGAVAIPGTALAVPAFLLFSRLGLTDTPFSVIEAARIDGAGEFHIFRSIALRLLAPGIVTVMLLSFVATWNNYFLPLIMLSDPKWFPLTVGLSSWSNQAPSAGGHLIDNLVVTDSLLAILPTMVVFLLLQRYWQTGITEGGIKE